MKTFSFVVLALLATTDVQSQITVTGYQSGFGTDVINNFQGISSVTLNGEISPGGPMTQPKSIANINSEFIAVAGQYGGTTTLGGQVLNIKRKSNGSNYQEIPLNYADIGVSTFKTASIFFDQSINRLYLSGFSGTDGVLLAFKWVVPLKGGNSTFILDNNFDSDGKIVIPNSKVMGVYSRTGDVFASVDKNSGIDILKYNSNGILLSSFTVPANGQSFRNSLKISDYPGVPNSLIVNGNEGNFPAIWIIKFNTTNNTFSLLASNSLNGVSEGNGAYRDVCVTFNPVTSKYDIVGIGTSEIGISNYSGTGFYQKFKGISTQTGYVNLISDSYFTNSFGAIGNGVYSNYPSGNCAMRCIQKLDDGGFIIMGLNALAPPAQEKVINLAYLSADGQTLTRVFVSPSDDKGHLGDEMVVENGAIYFAACAGQTIVGKLGFF